MESLASYAIGADGRVAWADAGFERLACNHGRPDLPGAVAGRTLDEFVAGESPRRLQHTLIERARGRGRAAPLELRYRCDAPEMRRHAVMTLTPQDDGAVVFTTWFESIEPRAHQPLLDYRLRRGDDVVQLCAWCNRVDVGGWREAEEAGREIALTNLPRVEHSVCEICELLLVSRPAG